MATENSFYMIMADGSTVHDPEVPGFEVRFTGSGNVVELHEGSRFIDTKAALSNGSLLRIGRTHEWGIRAVSFNLGSAGKGKKVIIGKNTSLNQARFELHDSSFAEVSIGDDNLWSKGISVRPDDLHQMFDVTTGEILNKPQPIKIHDHVWVGADVTFMKGAEIGPDSIVGNGSLVTKKFSERNVAIGGVPAKVLRRNVNWRHDHFL
ncbi:acyltransferase [Naumannella halotolerans]|uniref:acyltransferase n=1 Tax=Naumannella halotolerans TaxID=993414 RepID=UPI00370D37C7